MNGSFGVRLVHLQFFLSNPLSDLSYVFNDLSVFTRTNSEQFVLRSQEMLFWNNSGGSRICECDIGFPADVIQAMITAYIRSKPFAETDEVNWCAANLRVRTRHWH
jgi:hypothetical protein